MRDHSIAGLPHHALYYSPQVAHAARVALDIRYRLLDYAYTAFWEQTQTAAPMLNPMFFMYLSDRNTANLSYQFFWGSPFMVAPVTGDNSTSVEVYFPKGQFFDFYTRSPVTGHGTTVTLTDVGYDTIPLYFKGGNIIPMCVQSAYTTTEPRKRDFELVIVKDAEGNAQGSLYLDDGDSLVQLATSEIQFTYRGDTSHFQMTGSFGYNSANLVIRKVTVLGARNAGNSGDYDAAKQVATYKVNIPLSKAWKGSFAS